MRSLLLCSMLLAARLCLAADGANSILSLSHYDEQPLDFPVLHRQGVEAIIHEATYPAFDSDPKYSARQAAAARAGILWGAYHYGNASDPKRQADHFLDVVRTNWERSGERPEGVLLVLDAEKNSHYPGGSMQAREAAEFIERVRDRTGVVPGFYSGENWLKKTFASTEVDAGTKRALGKSWLWIANYHYQPSVAAPWSRWMLWQYTGDGVCGLPSSNYPTAIGGLRKMERTIFGGNREALHAFWKEHSWRPRKAG